MNILCHSGIRSVWSLYYSREPLGSGVKAWNAHYFPTGSRAQESTIAPRPDASIARTVGGLSHSMVSGVLMHLRHKSCLTQREAAGRSWCFRVLLKTSDLRYVWQLHCTKFHNIKKILKGISFRKMYWSSLSWELCCFFHFSVNI